MSPDGGDSAATSEAFPAPFMSGLMEVEAAWIDYNGHLNMAYYNVLFDRCVDQAVLPLGLGPDYVAARNASFFTAEAHVCYLREIRRGMPLRVSFQLLGCDDKRAHAFQELTHADEGWVGATSEIMLLHVDLAAKRVAPWPEEVLRRLVGMREAHSRLPLKPQVGRIIGLPRKGSERQES